ncbi:hypothetical protein H5410_014230 [Solanum commersonii]|uniref:Uncharacterized protein n=1 Tax=Solanum commersonii TaxID=4109 RepID=A0A9J5ZQE1_SOLCO|nr:hypothetical protein H5410_014230 [Solanum commersonii]
MELISKIFHGDLNKKWRSRGKYHSLDGIGRKNIKVTRFGGKRSSIWEFVSKRILKTRQVEVSYMNNEFDNRLIYEIYKSVAPSMELHPNM